MNLTEKEVIKTKRKIYIIIILLIILFVIVPLVIRLMIYKRTYYSLDINSENRNYIIELLEKEKTNIFNASSENYCNSLYKIEYSNSFPDGTDYKIYCKDEKDITFSIDKASKDVLANYIYKNGKIKTKVIWR